MTTELTLREKAIDGLNFVDGRDSESVVTFFADLLSATGAPAYIRVADDLRGVVREEDAGVVDYIRPYLQSSGEVVFGKPDTRQFHYPTIEEAKAWSWEGDK